MKQKTAALLVATTLMSYTAFLFTNTTEVESGAGACNSGTCLAIKNAVNLVQSPNYRPQDFPSHTAMNREEIFDHAVSRLGYGLASFASNNSNIDVSTERLNRLLAVIAQDIESPAPFLNSSTRALASHYNFETIHRRLPFNPVMDSKQARLNLVAQLRSTNTLNDRIDTTMARSYATHRVPGFRLLMNAFGSEHIAGNSYTDKQINLSHVLQEFWFNHFNVDYRKISYFDIGFHADGYEQTIYRNMHGTFAQLLSQVINHTAMLAYLDNGTNHFSVASKSASNQNLGRELLELHTLGIGPGNIYTQADVEGAAKVLAGLNVQWGLVNGQLVYRRKINARLATPDRVGGVEVAPVVLRKKYCLSGAQVIAPSATCPNMPPGLSTVQMEQLVEQRIAALVNNLAAHPRTRIAVCSKLTSRFVTGYTIPSGQQDNPATVHNESLREIQHIALRQRCQNAWEENGNLKAMYRAILTSPEFWHRFNYQRQTRNPMELVIAGLRASGVSARHVASAKSITGDPEAFLLGTELSRLVSYVGLPYRQWMTPTGYPQGGWVSQGYFVRWAKASFDISSYLEKRNPRLFTPISGIRESAHGIDHSLEQRALQLSTGAQRRLFVEQAMGLGTVRRTGFIPSRKIDDYLMNKLTTMQVDARSYSAPVKTGLNLKMSTTAFIRK